MKKLLIVISIFSISSSVRAEKWDAENNPLYFNKIIDTGIITKFESLPLKGKLDDERLGWSETYWPSNKGGIAFRWNHPDPDPFYFELNSKSELQRMTRKELSQLSPAELYDISQGDYTYTLTRRTLNLFTPGDLWWEGICHGWSLASANYPEPSDVIVMNPDGIAVPFGASDVKGLLSMHDAYNSVGTYVHVGARCGIQGKVPGEESSRDGEVSMPTEELASTPACKDMNAGSFHIVMTNMIGIHSKALVADVDRFNDVWNQPVVSYDSSILEEMIPTHEERLLGVERKIKMKMKFVYGEELQFDNREARARGENNFVSKKPVTRTRHQEFRFKDYEYFLELDGSHRIIGGEWITLTRPDFIWTKKRDGKFQNAPMPLEGLKRIYKPVTY